MIAVGTYTLDSYQEAAVEKLREVFAAGKQRPLLVAPTGTGKTIIALGIESLCLEQGTRVGFITSGRQLIFQKARKAAEAGLEYSVLLSNSEYTFDPDAQLLIVSKDTLKARWGKISWREPDLWIVDECDVAISKQWLEILSRGNARVIGLTATPITGHGHSLPFYDSLVTVADYSQLIDSGRLVDVPVGKVFAPNRPDLTGGTMSAGDWSKPFLSKRMNRPKLTGDIVEHWRRHAEERPTVVFCVDKAHTAAVCDHFNGLGIAASYIVDDTEQIERDRIFEATERGDNNVIVNCATLTRGWDLPAISCGVLARPTKSRRLYLQMVGRILRSHPSKSEALLIDHAGAVYEHGWPTEDRAWSLDQNADVCASQDDCRSKNHEAAPERHCPSCKALLPGKYRKCPVCGHTKLQRGQMAETEDGRLVAVTAKKKSSTGKKSEPQKLQNAWMGLLFAFGRTGRRYSNASSAFRQRYGKWPEQAGVGPVCRVVGERELRIDELFPFVRKKNRKPR